MNHGCEIISENNRFTNLKSAFDILHMTVPIYGCQIFRYFVFGEYGVEGRSRIVLGKCIIFPGIEKKPIFVFWLFVS